MGDGPAAFLTLLVGGLVVGLALWLELSAAPPFWVHVLLWVPLTVVLVSAAPLATSVSPPLTFQCAVLAPLTVQAPPTTLKIVKPRYCPAVPIELRSNVSEPVPPSWNVLKETR